MCYSAKPHHLICSILWDLCYEPSHLRASFYLPRCWTIFHLSLVSSRNRSTLMTLVRPLHLIQPLNQCFRPLFLCPHPTRRRTSRIPPYAIHLQTQVVPASTSDAEQNIQYSTAQPTVSTQPAHQCVPSSSTKQPLPTHPAVGRKGNRRST